MSNTIPKRKFFKNILQKWIGAEAKPEQLKFVLGRVESIVGKRENAGYQRFLLFLQCFQKASFSRSLTFKAPNKL